jgi:hypothetical protein
MEQNLHTLTRRSRHSLQRLEEPGILAIFGERPTPQIGVNDLAKS